MIQFLKGFLRLIALCFVLPMCGIAYAAVAIFCFVWMLGHLVWKLGG